MQSRASSAACGAKPLSWISSFGRRIAQDVFELRNGEPPVERQHDGAEPAAGELELEVFRAVGREQADTIALGDAEPGKRRGQPVGAPVDLGIGEFPAGLQVVDGELGRPATGVMGDPVVVGDRGHAQFTALVKPFQ